MVTPSVGGGRDQPDVLVVDLRELTYRRHT
jgi:hypothetical protein